MKKKIIISTFIILFAVLCLQLVFPGFSAEAAAVPTPTVNKVTLYVGYKNYKIKYSNLSVDAIKTFSSSDKKIATVTKTGIIKPIAKGITTVIVTIKQSKKTYTSKIKITVKNPYVSITKSIDSISIGANYGYEGTSKGLYNTFLVWSTSDDTIATIEKTTGILTAKRKGTTTITLEDITSGKKKQIKLNVIEPDDRNDLLALAKKRREEILTSKTTITANGTYYYVSNSGSDTNDGLSEKTAWASLDKVNAYKYQSGDAVLFERGGLWRGELIGNKGVTYSAWGEGDKPKFYGSPENGADPDKWSLLNGTDNIWVYYKDMTDCGSLIFNEGKAWAIKEIPSYVNGEFVLRDNSLQKFYVESQLDNNLEFFSEADSYITDGAPYRVSMQRVTDVIGKLYLRCDNGNPGEIFDSIEFLTRRYIISPADDSIYDNLSIKYGGSHAILSKDKQITVQNCEFGWIGGSIQYYKKDDGKVVRFGNAIEVCGSYNGFSASDNYIYQVYDAGLTNQETDTKGSYHSLSNNTVYSGNLIEYCTYGIEIFINAKNSGPKDHLMKNILVHDNIILYTGYGWGEQRYNKETPACIQLWDGIYPTENLIVTNNIFYLSTNRLIHCGNNPQWAPKLYGNTYVQNKLGLLGSWRLDGKLKSYKFSDPNLGYIIKNVMGDKSPKIIKLD